MAYFYTGIMLIFISVVASINLKNLNQFLNSCYEGEVTENECVKCTCKPELYFQCDPKPCNTTAHLMIEKKPTCHPNTVYILNKTSCMCTREGHWPHNDCNTTFRSFPSNDEKKCEPNSYVIVDCNVCRCGPEGILNKDRCTENNCTEHKNKTRRFVQHNQVYGSCETQSWYSLAPCQFCFCVSENKLICNTGNQNSKKLQLGDYNLSICGKELIEDAVGLIPDKKELLRIGNQLSGKESPVPTSTNNVRKPLQEGSVETNRENNEKYPPAMNNTNGDSDEYYSESEDRDILKLKNKNKSRLQTPVEEIEDKPNPSEETVNEISLEVFTQTPKAETLQSSTPDYQHIIKLDGQLITPESLSETFSLGNVLKPYLPAMLDKVFRMAIRKSLVSISPLATCKVGTTIIDKCNSCFCMKNGKLLCTNYKCD